MNKVQKIVDALHDAGSGQDVYDALCFVPYENLKDMRNMINDIENAILSLEKNQ